MAKNSFHFSRMLAHLLLAASAISLAYTLWMIYQNIVTPVYNGQVAQPAAETLQAKDGK